MAIGDIRSSTRQVQAPTPQVGADAFGAGIARGLRGLAQAQLGYEASELDLAAAEQRLGLAHTQRQRNLQSSQAQADLIRLQAQTTQDLETLRRDWDDPTGAGFTEAANQLVTERANEFLGGLPPALQEEFNARVATYTTGFIGVLLSPVHLCLVLTKDYFEANFRRVYHYLIPSAVFVQLGAMVYLFLRY